ncbi:MAG: hypothetical protein RDU83_13895 [bacterium]|nr:hypothetical protein [bacterium]
MTISLWTSILVAVVAGLFAAIIAPLVTARVARRTWRWQKRFELKYEIFRGAVGALAAWSADALDPRLQSSKADYKGHVRQVEIRPETAQALGYYNGLVSAFFFPKVATRFDEAARAPISIEKASDTEFDQKRLAFIQAAVQELGLDEN